MAGIFIISKEDKLKDILEKEGHRVYQKEKINSINDEILEFEPNIVILDFDVENSKTLFYELSSLNSTNEFDILSLINEKDIVDFSDKSTKLILKPVLENILVNEINLISENQNRLKSLHLEIMELKKNLYQIDAFYNASSKFAGTLDKEKLYQVMFETYERVLSFDIACALFKDNFLEDKIKFYINSLKKTTDEINNNLIKRLSLSALNEGLSELKPSKYEVEIIQNVKPSYKNEFYDSALEGFDSLYAPIIINNKFEGIIEIFRKTPFTKEDVTCFQSIAHLVLSPLRSAILYEDMINTNEKLKKLERIKSEFVSIVSHELRTPLTPINNALSIILSEQGGKIGDTNKNFANIAKRNVARLSGIIEDLLDLSRMQTGKFDFKFKKTSIYPSFNLAYDTFKNQASIKNIELKTEIDENLPYVYIDTHKFDQILSNIITNALKFTPEQGKITLSANIEKQVAKNLLISPIDESFEGEYIKISIKDTGVGIEKDDIPKIFDKFSQIENTLSRNTGGIGLGLTITKHFIDAHLGGIYVESAKNEGSTFNVFIPVYDDKKAFDAELNLKIKNESEVGYIKIEENDNSNFYNYLKTMNIIKLTKSSKELTYKKNNKNVNEVFISNLDRNAFDFMVSKIQEEINSKDCDILLTKAYYKKENA